MWWIWVLIVVVVLALGFWLLMVRLAANRPGSSRHAEPRRGQVQGGSHVGGGRSVGPRRDAEVIPDQDPETPTVPVRESRGNGPMDL